jgi:SAM-dependent MidA family methyltransferase
MVGESDGKISEIEAELSDPALEGYFRDEGISLVEGQQAETCLVAKEWITKIAAVLERGLVITIDYGYPAMELYAPYRKRGTLLAYHRHKVVEDVFQNVGAQDLTAHVDFTALVRWGKEAGLEFLALSDQLRFFLNLGIHEVFSQMEAEASSFAQYQADVQSAKALIMPGGMGETFKVLVQYKGLDEDAIKTLREKISSKYSFS